MTGKKRFTELFPEDLTYDRKSRIQKGKKILAVVRDRKRGLSQLFCLDVGCSVGLISEFLANHFNKVVGVDVDRKAIKTARQRVKKANVSFFVSNENKFPVRDASFDLVIFNQIYEHAQNPKALLGEVKRVLRPGGLCYFGARNKYSLFDGHYNIPLLSWLPRKIADLLVQRFAGKPEYDIRLFSLSQLNSITRDFEKHDYTLEVIRNPKKFFAEDVVPTFFGINRLIWIGARVFYFFLPNYIWLLEKRGLHQGKHKG